MKVIADHRPFSMFLTYKNMNETTPSPKKKRCSIPFFASKMIQIPTPSAFPADMAMNMGSL